MYFGNAARTVVTLTSSTVGGGVPSPGRTVSITTSVASTVSKAI